MLRFKNVTFLDFNKTKEKRFWVRHRRLHTEIPKNSLHIFCFGNQVNWQGWFFGIKSIRVKP